MTYDDLFITHLCQLYPDLEPADIQLPDGMTIMSEPGLCKCGEMVWSFLVNDDHTTTRMVTVNEGGHYGQPGLLLEHTEMLCAGRLRFLELQRLGMLGHHGWKDSA